MYKTLTKSPNASTKRLEDLVSPQQHVGSQANKAGTLASPRLGAGTNLSTGISSLKHTTSFFAAKSASHSTHSTSHHRTHSNDISSKYSVTDVKTSPRGASHHSQLNKKSSKTKSNQSQLHPISERSHDHKDSFVENIKAAVPKQSEIDLTKHVNLHTLEKTLESKEDKESDKDALHSKDSLDIRGPIRKTSVTNSEHRKEYEYKETITSPKLDTNSELDRMQRDNNSLVMDVPNPKMKKSITNLLNTINLTTDKPRHSPSVIAKRSSINKDQSQERRRTSVENGSRHSFVSESPPPASRFMPVSSSSVETGNIKVVARFRPLNKAENDLIANGLGSQCVSFPNNNTAVLTPENSVWTFDSVFPPSCRQQDVYDFLGKETIDDVLAGYNGTIFAYGQTSSGKTFTMYGNIHDQHTQGIIPRVGEHIFSFIDGIQDEVEFVINCSMLEIYKENLYDLLNDRTCDLKIKENPRKGIFVEGLNEISICSPEEMMEVLEIGERSRTIAATRMNQYSSRSHTLFMIDIIQRYPNRAEKRGKLNLIDLAGSEKVGKSGAAGETLEEAKKINLSLSCLGNVIHALTTNNDHIPYRDSKLTRILQESLGGNYKTSLIVTCSPHSSNKEESISTLKFATRAKTIKTHYKMNIQTSPDTMAYVMEKLKQELDDAKNELAKMKSGGFMYPLESLGSNINSDVQAISANFKPPEFAWKDKKIKITEDFPATDRHDKTPLEHETAFKIGMGHVISGLTDSHPKYIITNLLVDNNSQIKPSHTLRGSSSIGQLNRPMMERGSHDARKLHDSYHGDQSVHKSYDDYAYFKSNLELINENHILEARSVSFKETMETLRFVIAEKEQTIKAHEEKILMQKNEILQLENKVNTLTEQTDLAILKLNQQTNNSGYLNARVKVLEKEIESLSEALLHCEQSVNTLLQDKLKLANQKFEDMIKQDVELKQVSLPVYFKNFFNFNEEVHSPQHENYDSKNHSKIHAFANQTDNNVFRTLAASVTIPTNHASLVGQSIYGTAVKGSTLEDSNVSPQLTIYLLQQQLIQCSIINKQLERVISALEWKQIIEYGRAKIYSDYARMQENYIKNVEMVLEKAGLSHQKLKDRVEAMENDAIKLRETFIHQSGENKKMMPVTTPRAKLVRPIHKEKSNKLLFKKADATPGQSTTIKSHALLLRETSPQTSRNRVLGSYSTKNKLLSHDNFSSLMKEVEKEVAFSYTTPTTLEEAKLIISGQEQVIQKLKRCLKSNFNPENQHHYEAGGAHTFLEIDYLQSENERLENKLLILQTEFDSEKTKSEQLREAYLETKKQNEHYKQFNEELEISSKKAIRTENESWQKIIEELRIVNENEILRKQEEINKMHDILAKWIFKFMELQEQRGNLPSHQEKILYETYKRQELPASGLLYTALGSGTKFTPESGGLSARTSIKQSDQTNRKY